jgi:hypothetical protein
MTQDRCAVCVVRTIGSKIILDAPDGTPRCGSCGISFQSRLETVFVSVQYRCMVCAVRTIGSKIILDAPDNTPRWSGLCEILFWSVWRQCLCRCNIGARFAPNKPYAQKSFWTHPIILLGDEAQVEACLSQFGVVILMQERCAVCVKCTNGSKIGLGRTRWNSLVSGSCGISFWSVWR